MKLLISLGRQAERLYVPATKHGVNAAIGKLHEAADHNDALAQLALGIMCLQGEAVDADDATSVNGFRKAADHGQADAQVFLGTMYQGGYPAWFAYGVPMECVRNAMDGRPLITRIKCLVFPQIRTATTSLQEAAKTSIKGGLKFGVCEGR